MIKILPQWLGTEILHHGVESATKDWHHRALRECRG
jgi:hypothetical protein